jgi:hypothetical protein
MLIEKERVAVKKCKEDFLLLTASMIGMDPRVPAAHNFYKDMILDEIDAKMATAASASTPASASATTPATTSATAWASTPVMALASTHIGQYSSDGISGRSSGIRRAGRASTYPGGAAGVAKPLLPVIFMSWYII